MIESVQQPDLSVPSDNPENNLWLPPGRLRQYERAKVVGGLLMGSIFVGWLVLQWSNAAVRWMSIGLLLVTAWVVIGSMITDRYRAQGKQLAVLPDAFELTIDGQTQTIPFEQIAYGRWSNGPDEAPGLYFFDQHEKPLACFDEAFLNDEAKARTFLGWARERANFRFQIRWPNPEL